MTGSDKSKTTSTRRAVLTGVGVLSAGSALSGNATATTASGSSGEATSPRRTTTETQRATETIDALVSEIIDDADVSGTAVAVVHDGEIVLADGYGVADEATERPVEPTTPFRVGSVTKPVVWTAIAELIARGSLNIDTPVASYLDEDLISWDEPVTLAELATHTGGFELTNRNMWYPSPEDVGELPDHLDPMPAQVRSPGEKGSYSNHGAALAGQAFAEAVDKPFHEAMEEVLFEPAGMSTASVEQPLPESLYEAHATGHGGFGTDGKMAGLGISPAGALSASARDMAQFMLLHCEDGMIDGERVLAPETIQLSHQQWFTHHDALSGMALGFTEAAHGEVRVLRHDGASPVAVFESELRIVPEHDIGVFTAYNDNGRELELADTVLEELLPDIESDPPQPSRPHRAEELPGTYRSLRHGEHAHDSFTTTLNALTVDVNLADDGALIVDNGHEATRWIETDPLVFEREDDSSRLAFDESNGTIEYLFFGGRPSALVKTDRHESTTLHGGVMFGSLLGLGWAYNKWRPDRSYKESRREWFASARSNRERLLTATVWSGSTAFLAFMLVTLGYIFVGQLPFMVGYLTDPSSTYALTYALSVFGVLATAGTLCLALYAWYDGLWRRRKRLLYGLTGVLLLVTTSFLHYWNLLLP